MSAQSAEERTGPRSPGRPPGSRNKRDAEFRAKLEARGDRDPADFLSEIVSNPQEPKEIRVQAANYLLPYFHARRGSIIPPRYIEEAVKLPRPTTIEQANENIATISELKALGHIDLEFADSLIADNKVAANYFLAQEELKLKFAAQGLSNQEQVIHIQGGLPELPGCEIDMRDSALANGPPPNRINGHDGHVIDHEAEQIESPPTTEPSP